MVVYDSDCGLEHPVSPTWTGLVDLIETQSPPCAAKVRPHIDTLSAMSFSDLVELGNAVESLPSDEYHLRPICSAFEILHSTYTEIIRLTAL